MSGIAGIAKPGMVAEVTAMLDTMAHRGKQGLNVIEAGGVCLGAVASAGKTPAWDIPAGTVRDETGPGRHARAVAGNGSTQISRDALGAAPLYYGHLADGTLCFASEVKPLLKLTKHVKEMPPGATFDGTRMTQPETRPAEAPLEEGPEQIAAGLRKQLEASIEPCIAKGDMGSWLSGGLDSSAMVALSRPMTSTLHTFAGGLPGSPDLHFAQEVATHLKTTHHEVVLTPEQILQGLPAVIRGLESFDALLIRSTVVNYWVGKMASEYVASVFSGEGGDELFGGYGYLKEIPLERLDQELDDITHRLHNTALQRVDRSSASHGLTAHTCFLHPDVVRMAFRIPARYKIHNGVEKWILRRALDGTLPPSVVDRPKAKFWEGAGVSDVLAQIAQERITDQDFQRERVLPNGWWLDSKEELMYYRIFKEQIGELEDLSWMGRTKNLSRQGA